MSKMDGLRAMREARYAQAAARGATKAPATASKRPATKPATKPAATKPATKPTTDDAPVAPAEEEQLCGHRNMSGRTCTRELGHAAKSHRYS